MTETLEEVIEEVQDGMGYVSRREQASWKKKLLMGLGKGAYWGSGVGPAWAGLKLSGRSVRSRLYTIDSDQVAVIFHKERLFKPDKEKEAMFYFECDSETTMPSDYFMPKAGIKLPGSGWFGWNFKRYGTKILRVDIGNHTIDPSPCKGISKLNDKPINTTINATIIYRKAPLLFALRNGGEIFRELDALKKAKITPTGKLEWEKKLEEKIGIEVNDILLRHYERNDIRHIGEISLDSLRFQSDRKRILLNYGVYVDVKRKEQELPSYRYIDDKDNSTEE